MYTVLRQKTKHDDIELLTLETLTATRLEASEAQLKDYYFFEVSYSYKDMKGIEQKDIEFRYSDGLIWECSSLFDMVAIGNRYTDSDETIEENEIEKKKKELSKKCVETINTLVTSHKKGTINNVKNLQAGLDELSKLSTEGYLNEFYIEVLSLLQYEYCNDFKGDVDFYNTVSNATKRLFYGEGKYKEAI